MNYKIIVADTPNELNSKISEMLQNGWEPVGSHQVVIRRTQNRFSGQQHMDSVNQLEYSQSMISNSKNTEQ